MKNKLLQIMERLKLKSSTFKTNKPTDDLFSPPPQVDYSDDESEIFTIKSFEKTRR